MMETRTGHRSEGFGMGDLRDDEIVGSACRLGVEYRVYARPETKTIWLSYFGNGVECNQMAMQPGDAQAVAEILAKAADLASGAP